MFDFKKKKTPENGPEKNKMYMANLSHEIRTPMNAIVGIANLLMQKVEDPEEREYLKDMESATRNLLMTINGIIDYESMSLGNIVIAKEAFNLTQLIEDVCSIAKINIGERAVDFIVDADPDMPELLEGDPVRIKQVLVHLLSNADKFTSTGKITLGVHGKTEGGICKLQFVVKDTGIGMSEEVLANAFKPYEQANSSYSRDAEGLGIGLTISKSLVELMGGDLSVQSDEGKGSEFSFTIVLPVVKGMDENLVSKKEEIFAALYLESKEETDNMSALFEHMDISYVFIRSAGELFVQNEHMHITHLFLDYEHFKQIKDVEELKALGMNYVVFVDSIRQAVPFNNAVFEKRPIWYKNVAMAFAGEGISAIKKTNAGRESIKVTNARALVVDDNSINRKVTQGLLEPYGFTVDLAASAEEGIRCINRTRYDIVFMDHMMPGMDGAEATRIIRENGDPYYKQLPIIALSANAVEGVRDMFIQCGMNDYLPKPVEIGPLEDMIEKWLPKEMVTLGVMETRSGPSEKDAFNSFENIDISVGLSYTNGRMDMYINLVKDFASSIRDKRDLLKTLVKEEDIGRFTIEVHALKSTSKMIGAASLSEKALELERLGHKRDYEAIVGKMPSLEEEIEKIIKDLDTIEQSKEEVLKKPVDAEKVRDLLKAVFYAADDCNYDAAEAAAGELEQYQYDEYAEKTYEALKAGICEINYKEVKKCAVEMLANI